MIITLYKYNKRINSTNDPSLDNVSGLEVTGKIINNCSIITPVVELEYGGVNNVQDYNYAYIPKFKRYYFITNATFDNSKWLISLQCDVLASFRNSIMMSSQYVVRSSVNYNPYLVDDAYPTYIYPNRRYSEKAITPLYHWNKFTPGWVEVDIYNKPYAQGYYVLGIYSDNASGVTWYRFSASTFKDFIQAAMMYEPSDMIASNLPNGYAKALFDCTQYIVSCYWYPFQILNVNTDGGQVRYIKLGGYSIDIGYADTGVYPIDTSGVEEFRTDRFTLTRNPGASNYPYLDLAPYTEYSVWFPPFGFVPIDSTKAFIGDTSEIRCRFYVDVTTGNASFRIVNASFGDAVITERSMQIGIPIPISNMTLSDTGAMLAGAYNLGEYLGKQITKSPTVSNSLNTLKNWATTASKAISEDKLGIIPQPIQDYYTNLITQPDNFDFKNALLDATALTFGQLNSKGAPGSNLNYNLLGTPKLIAWFNEEVEHDDNRFGRPCRKILSLSTFSNGGYIECANASLTEHDVNEAYPTLTELNNILSYLNTGMFLANTK